MTTESRVDALQRWADANGATLTWSAPFVGETIVAVRRDGGTITVARGADAGQAAERASVGLTEFA